MQATDGLADRTASRVAGRNALGSIRRLCEGVQGLEKFRDTQV